MIGKISILALVVLCALTASVNGDDDECIAASVFTLEIAANATLFWQVHPKEQCVIDEFQVDIVGDKQDEYHFKVRETYVDLSFLDVCEEWQFVVTPISNGVLGYTRRLVEHVPLPPYADISLRYLNVTQTGRDLTLYWDLWDHTHGDCTLRYRLIIEDEDDGQIQDYYVTGKSATLDFLSPCVSYDFSLRAINRAHPTIEGPLRYTTYDFPPNPEEAPTLNSVDVDATSINMTLNLEDAGRNRCPVRTLFVDAGNYFNISIPIHNYDERPPVEVNLKGLQPNSMYFMKISVENSAGISQPAQIAVQTLELAPGSE